MGAAVARLVRALLAECGIKLEAPSMLEFRNDHGPACTCLACVGVRLGFRRGRS
jgi:hypothetical protein